MNKLSLLGSVGALLGGLVLANAALAQNFSTPANDGEQIIVTAPYITHEQQTIVTGNKGVYDVNSLTKSVSYADLDLTRQADDDMLIQRIKDTAKQSCAELRSKNPDPPHAPVYSEDDCFKNASGQALMVADDLIGRAKVAIVVPVTPPQQQTAEVVLPPEPQPQVEAEATVPPPTPPKQDRN